MVFANSIVICLMTATQKYRIQDLIEQIEKVDKMIQFNSTNPSRLMTDQYEDLKKRFLSELIEELMSIQDISKYSFKLINIAINKYYPELIQKATTKKKNGTKISKQLKEFKELEAVLVA